MLRRMLRPMVNDRLVIRSDGLSQQTRSRVAMKGKFVSIYFTEIRGPYYSTQVAKPGLLLIRKMYRLHLVWQSSKISQVKVLGGFRGPLD